MRDWRSRLGRREIGRDRMRVRSTGLWPPSKWLSPKPPVWVADQDLWMKVTKELDAAARGYEISRNEAAKIYRERGGAIKRSEPRLENRASRLRAERMQRLSAPKREPRFMEGGIVMGELDAIGSPEDIAHGLNITLEAAECIFEAIFKIPKARVEQAQKKYDKRMGQGGKGASRRIGSEKTRLIAEGIVSNSLTEMSIEILKNMKVPAGFDVKKYLSDIKGTSEYKKSVDAVYEVVEKMFDELQEAMGEAGGKGASRRSLRRRSSVSGLTCKVVKPLEADYFRWDLDTPAGTETLKPGFYLDVIDAEKFIEGTEKDLVFAAQNLSHEGERFQPSDKHLYLIDPDLFEECTTVVEN